MEEPKGVYLIALLLLGRVASAHAALMCETTDPADDPAYRDGDRVYVADCRIETKPSSPFVLSPDTHAKFTAEQEIRLKPGFHAQKGSHFRTQFRDCIRNPEPDTGYASWGSYDESKTYPGEMWMHRTATRFVTNFDSGPLVVALKYPEWSAALLRFYKDATLVGSGSGFDDIDYPPASEPTEHGIDEGVFYFYVAHGKPTGFQVRAYSGASGYINVEAGPSSPEMLLGNCRSDGTENGELRYLWLCSCRSFSHGPAVSRTDGRSGEFDRPSEFDGSADSETHRNVVDRWGPVLSENMRMACGISTRGTCSGNDEHHEMVDRLWDEYRSDGGQNRSVADAWGHALSGIHKAYHETPDGSVRDILTTPLCIAMGNADETNLRSPLTDDQRFTNKANPYDEAFHVVSWETENEGDTPDRIENVVLRNDSNTLPDLYRGNVILTSHPLANIASPSDMSLRLAALTTDGDARPPMLAEIQRADRVPPDRLPILLTSPSKASWQETFGAAGMGPEEIQETGLMMRSTARTRDNRPKMRVDTQTGTISVAGDRRPLIAKKKHDGISYREHLSAAARFMREHGWEESDMYQTDVIRSMLQVIPKTPQKGKRPILKLQKDITFRVGRRIQVGDTYAKVFGRDNMMTIQLNNDGSLISATKQWKTIDGKLEGVPIRPYADAYKEALGKLRHPGLYELSQWDWGYQSVIDDKGQDMMAVYYYFVFEPVAAIDTCISEPLHIEVQGHIF